MTGLANHHWREWKQVDSRSHGPRSRFIMLQLLSFPPVHFYLGSIFQNALKLLQYRNQKEYQHLRHYNFIFTENTRIYLKDINFSKKKEKK